MKLKKVTALLLATSMVLSSVSVASFADELVFEDEVVVAEDNSEEEASFDDVVFDDAAEEEADYAEDVFEDEVVEDVVDDAVAAYDEEVVEDPVVDDSNADIYEALAGAEVVEDVVDGETVTDEADYAKTAVTITLATKPEFTYGVDATAPTFNSTGLPTGTTLTRDWATGVEYISKTDGSKSTLKAGEDPSDLKPDTYTVIFDKAGFKLDASTYDVTVTESTITVSKAKIYAQVIKEIKAINYGADAPTATLDATYLTYLKEDKQGAETVTPKTAPSGTPVFKTTYKKGDKVGKYDVTYAEGLVSDYYEIVPATKATAGQFVVNKISVVVVPKNVTVEYGAEPVKPEYEKFNDVESGSADVLASDIAANKVTLSLYTYAADDASKTKVTPKAPGKYKFACELNGEGKGNYESVTVDSTYDYAYTVKNAVITFADYEGVYDGQYHGIIVTPDPSTLQGDIIITYNAVQNSKTGKGATKTAPKFVEPGKTVVYYFVDQNKVQTDFGYKTVTILDDSKAYEEVEAMIDKLPAADKVTAADKPAADAAKAAFDALPAEQQAKIPAAKVEKLNAVKAAADAAAEKEEADKKAAKAVEEQIDALPAAAEATADTKPAADAAKAAYDALTDAQKALVPADKVQKLNDVKAAADKAAEEKDKEAEKEKQAFDQEVVEVKAAKNGTEGKAAAARAKEAYENLSPEAKAKLTEEEIAAYEATQDAYTEGKVFENADFNGRYRVLSGGEVTYVAPLNKNADFFVVHNSVENNGFHYDVVKVSNKAFFNCANAKKIKVGKNVKNIGAYAFKKTSAMTRLIVNTSNLQSGKVTNAFVAGGKGKSGVQLKVQVPSGKSTAYENLFKGEGGMKSGAKFTEKD